MDPNERVVVEMTVDELSAVYSLVCMVENGKSEIDLGELRDNLDSMVDELYPGYDYIAEVNQEDRIELYQD